MQNTFPLPVLLILSTGLALRGQTTQDEQLKAKRAAEAAQLQTFSPAVTGGAASDEAAREQKKAAEAMYVVASAVAGSNRLVTGKPFAAEAVTETIQTLATATASFGTTSPDTTGTEAGEPGVSKP
jgi:hypothetical protein